MTHKHNKLVRFAQLLIRSQERITIEPDKAYQQITVRLWGKGVVERGIIQGAQIAATSQFVARPGQFIISRIDARNGALGLVPATLDGAVVTNDFPIFFVNTEEILPEFLAWMSKTQSFVDLCIAASEGTTNRVRLQEERFLTTEISLPPLDEQPRIVARIEALAGRVAEAQRLRVEAMAQVETFVQAKEMQIWPNAWLNDAPTLADVTQHLARGRQSKQGESNHYLIKTRHVQMGEYVRSDMMLDTEVAEKVSADAHAQYGDILIACSAAGCLGRVAQFDVTDQMASTDTHVAIARANLDIVLPEYLYAYLRGAQGQYQLRSRERGDWQREKISFRLTELNMNDLQKVPVPVPSRDEQRRIVDHVNELHAKVAQLRHYQASTQAELDALLPAILDKAFRGEL